VVRPSAPGPCCSVVACGFACIAVARSPTARVALPGTECTAQASLSRRAKTACSVSAPARRLLHGTARGRPAPPRGMAARVPASHALGRAVSGFEPGSAAQARGMLPGDILFAISGQRLDGMQRSPEVPAPRVHPSRAARRRRPATLTCQHCRASIPGRGCWSASRAPWSTSASCEYPRHGTPTTRPWWGRSKCVWS